MAKKVIFRIVITLLVLVGLGFIMFPTVSQWIYQWQADQQIAEYEAYFDEETAAAELERAYAYNQALATSGGMLPSDAFSQKGELDRGYSELVNLQGNGIMGYIEIPAISVKLPIYHGTSEEVLQVGAGHLQGTSLPVGSDGNYNVHAVIAAHTGLSNATMFDHLDVIRNGDWFSISVLGKKLWYQVDQVKIVTPDNTSDLQLIGPDYVTLVTCTPYGVNSHRLLVRAARGDGPPPEYVESMPWPWWVWPLLLIAAIVFLIVIVIVLRIILKRRRKKKEAAACSDEQLSEVEVRGP